MMTHNIKTRGAAMMLFVLFFAITTSSLLFILGQSIFADLFDLKRLVHSKKAWVASESITEDVVQRMSFGTYDLDTEENLTVAGVTGYSTTSYDGVLDEYVINSEALAVETLRKSRVVLSITAGSAFNYGLQAGNGGISLSNNSTIIGNVYSNGPVTGAGSAEVRGDVVSAGLTGFVQEVYATGTVYANSIDKIETGGDAHYNVDLNPTGPRQSDIDGTRFTPAVNQATTSLPISTTTIQEWKDAIADHGTVILSTDPACSGGTYTMDVSITIGYVKIECDVDIKDTGSPTTVVTLDGPVWIEGNLSFTQGPTIQVDSGLGRRSVQMIVDNPSDRLTSSKIEIRNTTDFLGSGDDRSYIMLLSMNESAEQGGGEVAIDISQSANGKLIAYTNTGLVEIGNGIDLREITGYQINIAQNTDVVYEVGLASLVFTSGPGGEYALTDWQQDE